MLASHVMLRPEAEIVECDVLAVGDTKPPVHAGRRFMSRSLVQLLAAAAGIERLIVGFIRGGGRVGQVLARAGARIDESAIAQFAPALQVKLAAPALLVRRKRSADIGAFVPANAKPAQVLDHGLGEFWLRALRVEVLIAKDQRATVR